MLSKEAIVALKWLFSDDALHLPCSVAKEQLVQNFGQAVSDELGKWLHSWDCTKEICAQGTSTVGELTCAIKRSSNHDD